jgi:Disulphide bond corrector protein DsbC
MNRPEVPPMTLIRTAALVVAVAAVATACPKDPGGEFGEGKPTTNDGTIGKRPELPEAPPDFANAFELAPAFDKATGKLTVTLKMKPGYHAYAPGEEIGKPVALTVDEAKGGWKVEGAVALPEGKKKDLGALGTSMILEGNVDLSAVVKGGTGDVEGTLEAQICTDKACDRPKKHAFKVPTA